MNTSTYTCTTCGKGYATIGGITRHNSNKHPETVTTVTATPEQMKPALDLLAGLRQFDTRNVGKPVGEWVQGAGSKTRRIGTA